jgi:hypothetical protein
MGPLLLAYLISVALISVKVIPIRFNELDSCSRVINFIFSDFKILIDRLYRILWLHSNFFKQFKQFPYIALKRIWNI